MSLAGLGAFNPAAILPKEFAFEKFFNKKKKNDKLPKSVPLAAFSGTCGWRPTGAVPSQIRSFVERFPQEFRLSSMSKCVLPMAENGLPFVTPEPEALLPSPMLSTLNALKLLQGKGFDRWDAKARCEAEMLYSNGIQVEWVPFPSYTAWQQYMEGSAVQQQSALQPHIVDTALMFLQWLEGPQILREISAVLGTSDTAEGKLTGPVLHAILSEGGKALDAKFLELNRGQASHRLKDAKTLLRCSSTESLKALLNFRKKALPIVANLFAQSWLLQPEWAALAGRSLTLDGQSFDVQTLVMSQAARALSSAEILTNTEIPRVRRSPLSLALFRELCNVQIPAAEYVGRLLAKYGGVSTRTLCGLMRRLLVDGEPRLRESFLQGYTVAVRSGGKDAFLFADCCPESEYALVEEKLQAQLDARTRESAAAAGEGSAAVQKSSDDAPAGDKEAMPAPASSGGEGGEEQATRVAPKPTVEPKQTAEQEQAARVEAAIQADVEVQMADVFLLYNGVPASPDQVPDLPQQQGRLWVVPPPNNSRGRPDRSVSVKLGHLPWLVAVGEGDAVLIGLGHNPGIADAVRTSLKEKHKTFELFRWKTPLPVMQKQQRSNAEEYVEYFLLGFGPQCPPAQGLAWVGPVPSHPDVPERLYQCEHQADPVAALACRKRKLAQLKDLPGQQVSSKRKRVLTEEERLLGETSEDEGTTEIANAESESEESVQEQEVAPKPNEKKLWARAWKQGLAPSTWVALLQSTSCNTVILTRPLHCQVGFLLGALQVADSRIGVGEFVAVAFAPADPGEKPPESDVAGSAKWLTRVAKRHLAAHTLDLASEVYMAQRRQAAEQIGKAAPKAAPLTKRLRQLFKRVSDPMDLPPGVPAPAPVAGGVKFEPMLVIRVPEKPMKESEHDSEDDDPTSLDKEKLSRWNQRLMEKFSLKVAGSGNAGSLGVFATNELAAGRRLRIKGAWFNAEADVLAHIQTMPEMASRIVRVDFPSDSKWCLLPSLFGLLRPGSRGASACISFDCGRALSHGLQLEVKKAIASGKEITFAKAAAPKKAAKVKKKSK